MENNNNSATNVKILKDFCGALVGKPIPSGVSKKLYEKVTKTYEFTEAHVSKNLERFIFKYTNDDIALYTQLLVNHLINDIFETDMFLETKSFMENILHDKEYVPSSRDIKKFVADYYGSMYMYLIELYS